MADDTLNVPEANVSPIAKANMLANEASHYQMRKNKDADNAYAQYLRHSDDPNVDQLGHLKSVIKDHGNHLSPQIMDHAQSEYERLTGQQENKNLLVPPQKPIEI